MALLKERTFICLVLITLLVFGVIMVRSLLPTSSTDQLGLDPSEFWSRKKYEFKNANIVIMGSSCTYRGISPDDIGLQLNRDMVIFNFGFSSGSLNPFMFKKANEILVKDKEKLRVVLLEISPIVFKNSVNHYQTISRSDTIHQLKMVVKPLNAKLFSTYFDEHRVLQYYNCYPNGWMACDSIPPTAKPGLAPRRKKPLDQRLKVQEYAGLCLDQVRQWREQGVLVFGYKPYTPCMENWDYSLDFDSLAYRKSFERAGGMWLDVDRQGLLCYDGIHLNEKSARLFSQRLGKDMADHLAQLGLKNDPAINGLNRRQRDAARMR